ncbi:MAG: hypothetical protein RBS39_09155 [Phycisphaerales bacterium]|jgi:hypothetical protein|nr:hypothetical protein [Phycisphaerales bacterium]
MDHDTLQMLLDEDLFIPMMAFGVAVVAIVFGTVTGMVKSIARERTRREIAAYIAEGSMTPEQGERILKAKTPQC